MFEGLILRDYYASLTWYYPRIFENQKEYVNRIMGPVVPIVREKGMSSAWSSVPESQADMSQSRYGNTDSGGLSEKSGKSAPDGSKYCHTGLLNDQADGELSEAFTFTRNG